VIDDLQARRCCPFRREFLVCAGLAGLGASAPVLRAHGLLGQAATARVSTWAEPPPSSPASSREVPGRDFDVTKRRQARWRHRRHRGIAACAAAGGGRVLVPDGRFLTGAIHLKSRINLHLADGATIAFSRNPDHYLPVVFTRWEGVELMNYSALIYAFEQRDIAITGKGTLDGQASDEHWWPWKGRRGVTAGTRGARRARLMDMAAAASGEGSGLSATDFCGRTSSSRTAARTCLSTASRS
jgi:hypothetical protein